MQHVIQYMQTKWYLIEEVVSTNKQDFDWGAAGVVGPTETWEDNWQAINNVQNAWDTSDNPQHVI